MPLLRAQRPSGIVDSMRALFSSSSQPDALDYLNIDKAQAGIEQANANTNRANSLAEKTRLEIEQDRQAQQRRLDPNAQNEFASTSTGVQQPLVEAMRAHLRGDKTMQPMAGPMQDGTSMPDASQPVAAPNLTPEQSRAVQAALGSVMANNLATGKTNAHQMTQAGGDLLTQAVRGAMAGAPDLSSENQLGHSINIRAREPFKDTQAGVLNEETGAVEPTDRSSALAEAIRAQANMRNAQGAAATTRAAPGNRPGRGANETDAQKREREARARRNEAAAAKSDEEAVEREAVRVKARFRQDISGDKNRKDLKLGIYDPSKKAWAVLDKNKKVVDWYR